MPRVSGSSSTQQVSLTGATPQGAPKNRGGGAPSKKEGGKVAPGPKGFCGSKVLRRRRVRTAARSAPGSPGIGRRSPTGGWREGSRERQSACSSPESGDQESYPAAGRAPRTQRRRGLVKLQAGRVLGDPGREAKRGAALGTQASGRWGGAAAPEPGVAATASRSARQPRSPEAAAPGPEGQPGRSPRLAGRTLRSARPRVGGALPAGLCGRQVRAADEPGARFPSPRRPETARAPGPEPACPSSSLPGVPPPTLQRSSPCP
ncbi:myristoylated alanine-rich C-kinase substrate-like [Saccopteryx leptura]|uniref:myristoylated alanine-rich C-kinase substrate-like n=1 Tax=Saccopteryx leptura TaxID=249018 RepID=UPI00339CA32B